MRQKRKGEIPLAPLERILKRAGARRVSKEALKEFATVLEDFAFELSSQAVKFAKHAKRKTLLDSDVRMAKKKLA